MIEIFKSTAKNYLTARKAFLDIADQTEWLYGKDNIVGRIGEFIAFQYLEDHKRKPKRPGKKTEKGYDFYANCNHKVIHPCMFLLISQR